MQGFLQGFLFRAAIQFLAPRKCKRRLGTLSPQGPHRPAKILWPFIKFETSGGFSFEPESCYKRRDRFEAKGQNGSHNSFSKSGDPEGLNFQNRKGKIVPYQAKQLGKKIKEYLAKRDDDEQAGKE
jgi:hypothetical protein